LCSKIESCRLQLHRSKKSIFAPLPNSPFRSIRSSNPQRSRYQNDDEDDRLAESRRALAEISECPPVLALIARLRLLLRLRLIGQTVSSLRSARCRRRPWARACRIRSARRPTPFNARTFAAASPQLVAAFNAASICAMRVNSECDSSPNSAAFQNRPHSRAPAGLTDPPPQRNDSHLPWSDDDLTAHELHWPIRTARLVRRARLYGVYAVVTAWGLAMNMSTYGPKCSTRGPRLGRARRLARNRNCLLTPR
jgi:hypothetical protein